MLSPETLVTVVQSEAVQRALSEFPKQVNAEMNKAFRASGTLFSRAFTRNQLSGGSGIKINRRARKAAGGKDKPSLPAKMRAAGFRGAMTGLGDLDSKRMIIRSRSPVLATHETGGVISSKKSRLGLAIRMKGFFEIPREKRFFVRAWGKGGKVGLYAPAKTNENLLTASDWRQIAHYKPSVTMKPRLRLYEAWSAFAPAAHARCEKGIGNVIRRFGLGVTIGPGPGDYEDAGEGI